MLKLSILIFAFLVNFVGDLIAAWGLYWLLRPVHAAMSMFVGSLRMVFAAMGLAAVLQLVTAHRLITKPSALAALGQGQRDALVHEALGRAPERMICRVTGCIDSGADAISERAVM